LRGLFDASRQLSKPCRPALAESALDVLNQLWGQENSDCDSSLSIAATLYRIV
jgi:hypothetical protein